MSLLIKYVTLLVILSLGGAAFSADNQIWLKQTLEGKFVPDGDWRGLRFKVEQEERFDEERLIDAETLVLLGWQMNPYLSVYLGHRWVNERAGGRGKMRAEQRPTFNLCLAAPECATLRFDFRSRFEYRDRHGDSAYLRYRERFRLRTSWSVTDFNISPYASMELFFSDKPGIDKRDLFDRTRTHIGLSFNPFPAHENLTCRLYYMVQHNISHHATSWAPTNVYGLEVGWTF